MATSPSDIDRRSGVTYGTPKKTTTPYSSSAYGGPTTWANGTAANYSGVATGVGGNYSPADSGIVAMTQLQRLADAGLLNQQPTNYPTSPGGGGGSSGGGGGGGATGPDYSAWGGWAAQAQPGMLNYNPLDLNYLDWDPSMFDRADSGINTGIADARKRGSTAFDLAAQRYLGYQDPYASGPKEFNPGVDPRLLQSMQAWGGAGSGAAAQQNNMANTADAAMGNIYDLLSNVGRQYNSDQLAAVGGDRMQFDQGIDSSKNELQLAADMARARSYGDWRTRDNDARNQTAMANWARQNQVSDTNVGTTNAWNQNVLDAILSMIGSGGTGIPQAGNDLSKLITMSPYRA